MTTDNDYTIADKISTDTAALLDEGVPVAWDDNNLLTEDGVALRLEVRDE